MGESCVTAGKDSCKNHAGRASASLPDHGSALHISESEDTQHTGSGVRNLGLFPSSSTCKLWIVGMYLNSNSSFCYRKKK